MLRNRVTRHVLRNRVTRHVLRGRVTWHVLRGYITRHVPRVKLPALGWNATGYDVSLVRRLSRLGGLTGVDRIG